MLFSKWVLYNFIAVELIMQTIFWQLQSNHWGSLCCECCWYFNGKCYLFYDGCWLTGLNMSSLSNRLVCYCMLTLMSTPTVAHPDNVHVHAVRRDRKADGIQWVEFNTGHHKVSILWIFNSLLLVWLCPVCMSLSIRPRNWSADPLLFIVLYQLDIIVMWGHSSLLFCPIAFMQHTSLQCLGKMIAFCQNLWIF